MIILPDRGAGIAWAAGKSLLLSGSVIGAAYILHGVHQVARKVFSPVCDHLCGHNEPVWHALDHPGSQPKNNSALDREEQRKGLKDRNWFSNVNDIPCADRCVTNVLFSLSLFGIESVVSAWVMYKLIGPVQLRQALRNFYPAYWQWRAENIPI